MPTAHRDLPSRSVSIISGSSICACTRRSRCRVRRLRGPCRPTTRIIAGEDALVVRIRHKGIPIDNVLATGLDPAMLRRSGASKTPRAQSLVPAFRLHASFGDSAAHGLPVPDRLRPSPLHYICRPLPDTEAAPLINHLASRRLEFFDFDVT